MMRNYVDELEKIIIKNIEEIPKVPLSVLLSGGIDSSLVLALIKKVYTDVPIHTFSLARSKDYPDIIYSEKIAKMFNTIHHEIILSKKEIEEYSNKSDIPHIFK